MCKTKNRREILKETVDREQAITLAKCKIRELQKTIIPNPLDKWTPY